MFRKAIVTDILVVMFLVSICTIAFGAIVKDPIAVGVGGILLLLFIFLLWAIKRFRKH